MSVVTQDDWDDVMPSLRLDSEPGQFATKELGVFVQRSPRLLIGFDPCQSLKPPLTNHRRKSGGENQLPASIDEQVFERFGATNIGAWHAQSLSPCMNGGEH